MRRLPANREDAMAAFAKSWRRNKRLRSLFYFRRPLRRWRALALVSLSLMVARRLR